MEKRFEIIQILYFYRLSCQIQIWQTHHVITNLLEMNFKFYGLKLMVIIVSVMSSAQLFAQDAPGAVTNTYALENVHVITSPGNVINNASIVIKDGLIQNVGRGISIPANAKKLKVDTMFVYAGFIDGLSHIGLPKPKANKSASKGPKQAPGNPTNERAGITPHKSVQSLIDPKSKTISDYRQAGYTAVHTVPYGKMLPGQGTLILLNGARTKDMVYEADISTFSQLKGASGVFPNTIIGVMTKWRELFKQAEQANHHISKYKSSTSGMKRPTYDASTHAMIPVTKGQSPVFMLTESHLDIHRAMTLQKDLGFKMTLTGLKNGWRLTDKIKANNHSILLSLNLPKKEKDEKKKNEAVKDKWADEKSALMARQKEEIKNRVMQAASFEKSGVRFGFTTEGTKANKIKENLLRMVKEGLSEKAALAALTTNPAAILGVQHVMGTVEKGKIANLVISKGSYFDEKSEIRYVVVDGHPHKYEPKSTKSKKSTGPVSEKFKNIAGTWSYVINTGETSMTGELDISEDNGGLVGILSGSQIDQPADIDEITIDGNTLSFSVLVDGQVQVEWTGTIEDDEMTGTVNAEGMGTFSISGTRTQSPE